MTLNDLEWLAIRDNVNYSRPLKSKQMLLQIARISAPLEEIGVVNTLVTSDFEQPEVEIWRFCACAVNAATVWLSCP